MGSTDNFLGLFEEFARLEFLCVFRLEEAGVVAFGVVMSVKCFWGLGASCFGFLCLSCLGSTCLIV